MSCIGYATNAELLNFEAVSSEKTGRKPENEQGRSSWLFFYKSYRPCWRTNDDGWIKFNSSLTTYIPTLNDIVVRRFVTSDHIVIIYVSWQPLFRNMSVHFSVATFLHFDTVRRFLRNRERLKSWWWKRPRSWFNTDLEFIRIGGRIRLKNVLQNIITCIDAEWTPESSCENRTEKYWVRTEYWPHVNSPARYHRGFFSWPPSHREIKHTPYFKTFFEN